MQAVLFHCSHGKDRTGIIAALLLKCAGVSDEDVINDYALSVVCPGRALSIR
jgi:protein-tyrosine phosphatase